MLMRYFAVFGGGEGVLIFGIQRVFCNYHTIWSVASSAQEPHRARDGGIKQCKSVLCINVLNLGSPGEPV